jgi:hypothetical protein
MKREAILKWFGDASLGDSYAFSRQGRDVDQAPFQGNTARLKLGDLKKARQQVFQVQTRPLDDREKVIVFLLSMTSGETPEACIWTPPQLGILAEACRFGFFVRCIRGN